MRNTKHKIHENYLKVKDKNSEKSASFIVRLKASLKFLKILFLVLRKTERNI